ncbi:WD40 repeat-like protein [Ascobolus immersus RN42]|uniref:WD40 repeat-like protein n=1 Tax=Ascobolus immersus RN42 TaxID=1160509 RepID=A0A3N4IEI7_ASCIM|nr:WD40 repeat-like protein [Ascobolus immersus RN42]
MPRPPHARKPSDIPHPANTLVVMAQALTAIGGPGPEPEAQRNSRRRGYVNSGTSPERDSSSYTNSRSSYDQGYSRDRSAHQSVSSSASSYPPEHQAQSSQPHSTSTTLQGGSNASPQPFHNTKQSLTYSNSSSRRPDLASHTTAPAGLQQVSDSRRSMNSQSQRAGGGVGLNVHTGDSSRDQKYTPNPVDRKYVALTPTSAGGGYGHQSSHSQSGHFGLSEAWSGGRLGSDATVDRPQPTGYVGNGKYLANWCIYAMDWCKWPIQNPGYGKDGYGKVAIASYCEDSHNYIQVLNAHAPTQRPGEPAQQVVEYTKIAETSHIYPITRILWEPPSGSKTSTDLMATSGDHLRLWSLPNSSSGPQNSSNTITRSNTHSSSSSTQKLTPLALLSNSKSSDSSAPLTSLDWNPISSNLIITSSIDTTCTIWDIPSLTAKTQLIAHDKEVFDVRFMSGSVDVFASCGADGSVRMFDLRSLEHSTIIYEPTVAKPSGDSKDGNASPTTPASTLSPPPLLRLAASPHDQHLLATITADSNIIRILDVRQPGTALMELRGASGAINCLEWAPARRGVLAAGSDDSTALVWDLYNGQDGGKLPISGWRSEYEVNSLSWSPPGGSGSEWLGVAGGRGITGVRAV